MLFSGFCSTRAHVFQPQSTQVTSTHFRTWSGTGKRWVCLLSLPKLRLQHLDDMHPGYTALPRLVVFDAYDPTVATHLDVLSDV